MVFDDADFCDSGVHERQVVMGDGKKHTLWFKQLPVTDWKRFYMWLSSEDEEVRASAEARLVALGLCEPDGSAALTVERACQLKLTVLGRLMKTLREVNGHEEAPDLGNG